MICSCEQSVRRLNSQVQKLKNSLYERSAAVAFSLCLIFVVYLGVSIVLVLAAVYTKVHLLLFILPSLVFDALR